MNILNHFSLKKYNSFGVECQAKNFVCVTSIQELIEVLQWKNKNAINDFLILGSGSNILLAKDYFNGLVIHNKISSINVLLEDENKVIIRVQSGMIWNILVEYCVERGWGGFENLTLIPGTVGATPIQNIGAYGTEINTRIIEVEYIDLYDIKIKTLSNKECKFGYRDSIFKKELKNKVFILSVKFLLSKKNTVNISYKDLTKYFHDKDNTTTITIQDVSRAVKEIRQKKIPNPEVIGNAGSFFLNPVIHIDKLKEIKKNYSSIPIWNTALPDMYKISAAWLIEQCKWKNKFNVNVACHEKQTLVLLNKSGNAKGKDILKFAEEIMESIWKTFRIQLEVEVNILS